MDFKKAIIQKSTSSVESNINSGCTEVDSETSEKSTSNPPSQVGSSQPASLSIFGDTACGEPLRAQHLVIDFTPDETIDNDYVQKKCCAFWKFIDSHPELNCLMALPDTNLYTKASDSDKDSAESMTAQNSQSTLQHNPLEKSALSALSMADHEGMIEPAFVPKTCESHCTMGSREYRELQPGTNSSISRPLSSKIREPCTCSGVCKVCRARQPAPVEPPRLPPPPSHPEVRTLCQKLTQWDKEHPKSMEPPGHPPALSHAILQRLHQPL